MDDSGNKVLEFEEFHKGIIETGLKGITEDDAKEMFAHFDKDGGGTVNIDEFLMAIRVGTKVSLLGVDSLWSDCTFIPAYWGS